VETNVKYKIDHVRITTLDHETQKEHSCNFLHDAIVQDINDYRIEIMLEFKAIRVEFIYQEIINGKGKHIENN
jgi:hypothetical protein